MQGSTRVVLGIDAGTTSVKTVAFSLTGETMATSRSSVHIERRPDGAAEVSMDSMWRATAATMRDVMAALPEAEVAAIGVTGQGDGAWLVASDGEPVRPAALWLDGRASERVQEWQRDGRARVIELATGSALFAGALPALVDVLRDEDPTLLDRAAHHLNCKDWIRYRMTGEVATDPSEASRTYLQVGAHDYANALPASVGQPEVARLLAPLRAPTDLAGTVHAAAARELGVPPGIPVAVGLVDTAAAGVGLGALADAEGYLILGTTGFVGINQPNRAAARSSLAILLETGRGDQVLECLAPMTGTPNLDWMRDIIAPGVQWDELAASAAVVPPGSNGVLYLPYGSPSGERAPFLDPAASASWLGMSVSTSPSELVRSVYEGLAYALTECMDVLGLEGEARLCGGGSDSDLMCQILADVSGRVIARQCSPEVGARGAAAIALTAAGEHESLEAAVEALLPPFERFEPHSDAHATYLAGAATFAACRDALRPHWPSLRNMRAS